MNESMGGSTQMIWEHNKKKRCSQCGKRFRRGAWCEMCQERHCFDCGSCVADPESDNLYSEGHTMQYTRRCDEGHRFTFYTPDWGSRCGTCHTWLYDTGTRIGLCNDSNHRQFRCMKCCQRAYWRNIRRGYKHGDIPRASRPAARARVAQEDEQQPQQPQPSSSSSSSTPSAHTQWQEWLYY